jgi:hypothetical protein
MSLLKSHGLWDDQTHLGIRPNGHGINGKDATVIESESMTTHLKIDNDPVDCNDFGVVVNCLKS